jgi:NAD-dependent dihydropyrimidine dehydrogenase PreA subunit
MFLKERSGDNKTALIKDDDLCIRCGLCAKVCQTNAMTLERFEADEQILCVREENR